MGDFTDSSDEEEFSLPMQNRFAALQSGLLRHAPPPPSRPDDAPACWICLDEDGQLLQGCACRGTSGYLHAKCLAKSLFTTCPTCKQDFVGELRSASTRLRMRNAAASGSSDEAEDALHELGIALGEEARYEEARDILERVLASRERRLGPEDSAVLDTRTNLAIVFDALGRHDDALRLNRTTLAVYERPVPGGGDTFRRAQAEGMAATQNNIGGVLCKQQQFAPALRSFEAALTGFEDLYGVDSVDAALARSNCAGVLLELGRTASALSLLRHALSTRERVLGASHPLVADTQHNIALVLCRDGQHDDALDLLGIALRVRIKALGAQHPLVNETRELMAEVIHEHVGVSDAGPPRPLTESYGSSRSADGAAMSRLGGRKRKRRRLGGQHSRGRSSEDWEPKRRGECKVAHSGRG
jgi:tetratricopeptide (TPR) repeat protein